MVTNIKIEERSYGGKKFRPTTAVDFEASNNQLICVTAWGQHDIAGKVTESIKNFITMAKEDTELTVPYARKENLQQLGNVLRMAIIMASEKVYKEYNKDEYVSGFEVFAGVQDGSQWIFVNCGQPSLILCRQGLGVIPLSQAVDLNVLTMRTSVLDPLPNNVLGLGQHPPINYGNIRLRQSDKLALISRTYLPSAFYKLNIDEFNSKNISNALAQDNQELPFWLGFIRVD